MDESAVCTRVVAVVSFQTDGREIAFRLGHHRACIYLKLNGIYYLGIVKDALLYIYVE